MQDDLFGAPPSPPAPPSALQPSVPADGTSDAASPLAAAPPAQRPRGKPLSLCPADDALTALAAALPASLRLGTSSWAYPGWQGLVWEGAHSNTVLSQKGLTVYGQHPLLRTVSIDRSFYRPMTASQYEAYAVQVPDDFRFMVKAPSLVTDALVRSEDGRGREPNTAFLSPELALSEFVVPALQGLGHKLGALVFQLSPLPLAQLDRLESELLPRLRAMLWAQPALKDVAPDAVLAVEVRDPEWLTPAFAAVLREAGATYCLGLHAKMPPLQEQLPVLRALWPGPLVCRWNLNPVFGPYGYEDAEKRYSPYDRLHDLDPQNHAALAALAKAFTDAGQNAFIAISNHAEGSAPLSVRRLAEQVAALRAER
jgi:uncharacterized protein YecE (DUF72 family)